MMKNIKGILTKDNVYYTTQDVQFSHLMIIDAMKLNEKDIVRFEINFRSNSVNVLEDKFLPDWYVCRYDKSRVNTNKRYFERYNSIAGLTPCVIDGNTNKFSYFPNLKLTDYFSEGKNNERIARYVRMVADGDKHILNDDSKLLLILAYLFESNSINNIDKTNLMVMIPSHMAHYLSDLNNDDYVHCEPKLIDGKELVSQLEDLNALSIGITGTGELGIADDFESSMKYYNRLYNSDIVVAIKDDDGEYLTKVWVNVEGTKYIEYRNGTPDYIYQKHEKIDGYRVEIRDGKIHFEII